jgi:hypothetical protein
MILVLPSSPDLKPAQTMLVEHVFVQDVNKNGYLTPPPPPTYTLKESTRNGNTNKVQNYFDSLKTSKQNKPYRKPSARGTQTHRWLWKFFLLLELLDVTTVVIFASSFIRKSYSTSCAAQQFARDCNCQLSLTLSFFLYLSVSLPLCLSLSLSACPPANPQAG